MPGFIGKKENLHEAFATDFVMRVRDQIISKPDISKLRRTLKDDPQSMELVRDIFGKITDILTETMDDSFTAAIGYLRTASQNSDPMSARNLVFKSANLLKIKLPSAMF